MEPMRYPVVCLALCALMPFPAAAAGDTNSDGLTQALSAMTVTATRSPEPLADVDRSVTIIDRAAIERSPAHSIAELLESVAGVDIRQRGAEGSQADLSIRGSTFEQTLVLVDGMPLGDPQTGHHSLDIPLPLDAIERIEILAGQSSRMHGPAAIGGVVNIITRQQASPSVQLAGDAGSFNRFATSATAACSLGLTTHRVSLAKSTSDGYRYNSAYDDEAASYVAAASLGRMRLGLLGGYLDKTFGANGFYSDAFPDQWEHTTTMLTALNGELGIGPFTLRPSARWRQHYDDFMLDRDQPQLYRNRTTTDVFGGGVQSSLLWRLGELGVGVDATAELLSSDDLGDRTRYRGGIYLDQRFELWQRRITLTPGATLYYCTGQNWKLLPGLDVGIRLGKGVNLFATIDYSFRVPTFTELYYNSPRSNLGDPDLVAEKSLSIEGGVRYTGSGVGVTVSGFGRNTRDQIDWVRWSGTGTWQAANVDEVTAGGGEAAASLRLPGWLAGDPVRLEVSYAFVDEARRASHLAADYVAAQGMPATAADTLTLQYKYGSDYLRHKLSLAVDHPVLAKLRINWCVRYELREGSNSGAILLDSRAYVNLKRFSLFAEVTNLFDEYYRDMGQIPMPGRAYRAGVSLGLFAADRRLRERGAMDHRQEGTQPR